MKINGMKMHNYWLINGIYNFLSFGLTAIGYWGFGRFVAKLDFFMDTNALFFLELFICWGLC